MKIAILRQGEPRRIRLVGGGAGALQVVLAAGIPLGDRKPRIVCGHTLIFRLREGKRGPVKLRDFSRRAALH